jgi:hypothetical protein
MAYGFIAASNQSLNTTSSPVSGVPVTLACWVKCDTLPSVQTCIFGIGVNTTTNTTYITLELGTTNRPQAIHRNGGAQGTASPSTGSITAGQWFHVCGVFETNSLRTLYWNGVAAPANTTIVTPFTATRIQIARRPNTNATGASFLTGNVAETAVWNDTLTAAEIASLAKGMTCDKIRPQNLAFYAPLVRDLIDQKGGRTITNNNSATVAAHTRVYA